MTIAGLGYDGISSTNRGGSTSIAILFVAGGSHPTELQEEQVIADGFVESVEYLVDNDMAELETVIADDSVIDWQGCIALSI